MKKSGIRIIVDNTVDYLSGTDKNFVSEVKIHLFMNNKEVNLDKKSFYKKIRNNSFRTSQPNPDDFLKIYEKYKDKKLIVLTLTSKLSGTHNSALIAKKKSKNQYISVIDSRTTSAGLGILVKKATSMIKEEYSYEEIIKKIKKIVPKIRIFLVLKKLKYLVRRGRINKSLGVLDNIVHLKPVIGFYNGELKSAGKMLLFENIEKGFYNYIHKRILNAQKIYLLHNNMKREADYLKKRFGREYGVEVIDYLNPALGVYSGPECIAIGWIEE